MLYDSRKTSEVIPSLNNRKPYRTKAQKQAAKANAVKNGEGYYNSYASRSWHKEVPGNAGNSKLQERKR